MIPSALLQFQPLSTASKLPLMTMFDCANNGVVMTLKKRVACKPQTKKKFARPRICFIAPTQSHHRIICNRQSNRCKECLVHVVAVCPVLIRGESSLFLRSSPIRANSSLQIACRGGGPEIK